MSILYPLYYYIWQLQCETEVEAWYARQVLFISAYVFSRYESQTTKYVYVISYVEVMKIHEIMIIFIGKYLYKC